MYMSQARRIHVTSYTYQYRKRRRHDVAVATFIFHTLRPRHTHGNNQQDVTL